MTGIQKTAVVTGDASGLGLAIKQKLVTHGFVVYGVDIKRGHDVREPRNWSLLGTDGERRMASELQAMGVDALVNCAGVNRQDWIENMTQEKWDRVMSTNAYSMLAMTQLFLEGLKLKQGAVCNIVSNAAHVPMTCSSAYNASKGAALILTKQMARELTKLHGITVFSVSPNKLAGTQMSNDIEREVERTRGWTPQEAWEYQKAALLTGEETPPGVVAELIGFLLSNRSRHRFLSGCDIPYGV